MAKKNNYTGISLFTGAGGMDVGFRESGVDVIWANELVEAAAETYKANHPDTPTIVGDITACYDELPETADIVFGGPPCQGFSVAGKMDPDDPRSQLIFAFLDVVEKTQPSAFVMENVKALGVLGRWSEVRDKYFERVAELGYTCHPFVCKATDFDVPQKRERVFFIGIRGNEDFEELFGANLEARKKQSKCVKDVLSDLGRAGTENNPDTCTAKITYAKNPVMRSIPWAGMYFNGAGRPIDLDGYANTLPASMGGNKTPIVDEEYLYGDAGEDWMWSLYNTLVAGGKPDGDMPPSRMRRITIKEAARIQTFPDDYIWCGGKSAVYKQIGNAVPSNLAKAVSAALLDTLAELGVEPKQMTP